ncbi:MAG: hypothetical protein KAX16_06570 [Actinomycetia bacterium]|nr:hypothetical protein [Actinomycetes bacterium]
MKKLICLTIAIFFLTAGNAFAESKVTAGIGPESPFYWFDRLAERIQLVFTLDPQDKVKALNKIGHERLLEAQEATSGETVGKLISDFQKSRKQAEELAGDGVDDVTLLAESESDTLDQLTELAESASQVNQRKAANALASAISRLTKLNSKLEKIAAKGSDNAKIKAAKAVSKTTDRLSHIENKLAKMIEKASNTKDKKTAEELSKHVKEATGKHITVLKDVLINAPEQAKKGLQNAIDRSSGEHNTAPDAVNRRGPKNTEGTQDSSSKKNKNK